MPNLLIRVIVVTMAAVVVSVACDGRHRQSDEERIWAVTNDDNHPAFITIGSGENLDLRGLLAFRVLRTSTDESFGFISCVQHGYLIAFREGNLAGVKLVGAIRDAHVPDPAVPSSGSTSVVARRPDALFTTEGATVGTDGYLLMYRMYDIVRTPTAISFVERWSDIAVDFETQAGNAKTILFGTLNVAMPPAGSRSFYYARADLLTDRNEAKQCVPAGKANIVCIPWAPPRDQPAARSAVR